MDQIVIYFTNGTKDQEGAHEFSPAFGIKSFYSLSPSKFLVVFEYSSIRVHLHKMMHRNAIYYDEVLYKNFSITKFSLLPPESSYMEFDIWKCIPRAIPTAEKRTKVISLLIESLKNEDEDYMLKVVSTCITPLRLMNLDEKMDQFLNGILGYHKFIIKHNTEFMFSTTILRDIVGFVSQKPSFLAKTGTYDVFLNPLKTEQDDKD